MPLVLTLNIFHTKCSDVSTVDFGQVNTDWVSNIKMRYSGHFLRALNIVLLNVSSQDENHSGVCAMLSGLKIKDVCPLILKYNP